MDLKACNLAQSLKGPVRVRVISVHDRLVGPNIDDDLTERIRPRTARHGLFDDCLQLVDNPRSVNPRRVPFLGIGLGASVGYFHLGVVVVALLLDVGRLRFCHSGAVL